MIYLNLNTSTLRSPQFIGSEPTARATWLSLICYCCEQENGGTIPECQAWKDRQWQQTCGVTYAEVNESSDLWKWSGNGLSVAFYPKDKEAEVQAKREAGRRGGKRSGKARREAVLKAPREAELQAELQAVLQADLERKGKEGKGIERERKVKRVATIAATNDEDWLNELAKNPAYASIDIRIELGKMQAWCSANNKQPSCKRFVNWLNRAEKPIAAQGAPLSHSRKPMTAWELKQAIDAIKTQMARLRADPENTEVKNAEIPWERQVKPEIAEKLKELKDRERQLHDQLTMLGQEHTPRLKL